MMTTAALVTDIGMWPMLLVMTSRSLYQFWPMDLGQGRYFLNPETEITSTGELEEYAQNLYVFRMNPAQMPLFPCKSVHTYNLKLTSCPIFWYKYFLFCDIVRPVLSITIKNFLLKFRQHFRRDHHWC